MASNNQSALLKMLGVNNDEDPDPLMPPDLGAGPLDTSVQQTLPVGPKVELPETAAPPPAAQTWNKGVNANNGMILGYGLDKLNDTSYHSGKYNDEVRAFSDGLKNDVGVSRGGLGNMNEFLKSKGYQNSTLVGDDKIDFDGPDGPLPPIDVIKDDGSIVFQDPRGAEPGASSGSGGTSSGGMGGGIAGAQSNLNGLLQGDPTAKIQQAIEALMQGGNRPNLQALLAQLGGG